VGYKAEVGGMGLAVGGFGQGLLWPIVVLGKLEESRCKLAGGMGLVLDVG